MSVTNPAGKERFIAAAFPSACGKTNMAMLRPTIPGWTVKCIGKSGPGLAAVLYLLHPNKILGDDIAWMRFREDGQLVAINPENGFFGVGPGKWTLIC